MRKRMLMNGVNLVFLQVLVLLENIHLLYNAALLVEIIVAFKMANGYQKINISELVIKLFLHSFHTKWIVLYTFVINIVFAIYHIFEHRFYSI